MGPPCPLSRVRTRSLNILTALLYFSTLLIIQLFAAHTTPNPLRPTARPKQQCPHICLQRREGRLCLLDPNQYPYLRLFQATPALQHKAQKHVLQTLPRPNRVLDPPSENCEANFGQWEVRKPTWLLTLGVKTTKGKHDPQLTNGRGEKHKEGIQ